MGPKPLLPVPSARSKNPPAFRWRALLGVTLHAAIFVAWGHVALLMNDQMSEPQLGIRANLKPGPGEPSASPGEMAPIASSQGSPSGSRP